MTAATLLLAAALEIVADGAPRVHVETDGSPPALFAADLVKRHVVLMTGTALPDRGTGAAVRFERSEQPGYRIVVRDDGAVVRGADLARAAYDILEAWGCRFDAAVPVVPKHPALSLAPAEWKPARRLLVEAEKFDPALPADGIVVNLHRYRPDAMRLARELGYEVRVVSETFDDFLPPALFATHPEWFAARQGERAARGNFALTNADARNAYLDNLGAWLEAHPDVDTVGLWPEVTSVWDEHAAKAPAESYALLWREAADRFPERRFEILATGLTLRPPSGQVPDNVEVRLRTGRDASALQGVAGQEIESVVKAWEVRGARPTLEIDAAPASWCGMPWPCEDAIRENARRFDAAVLRAGHQRHARLWRDPTTRTRSRVRRRLLKRAAHIDSWGHPRDAADLFFEEEFGLAFRLAATERLYRLAADASVSVVERRTAAADAYLGFRWLESLFEPATAEQYRRFRSRDYRRLLEELLPAGVERQIGPARVADGFDTLTVETDRLQLVIDRKHATVDSVRRRMGKEWSADLAGGRGNFFAVVALRTKTERTDGEVSVTSPETGRVRIELTGLQHRGGPRWTSVLEYSNASGLVRQTATVDAAGGIAAGCRWQGAVFDRWVCPPHAAEGRLDDPKPRGFHLPRGTLLYCRDGERGPGLAARPPNGAVVSILRNEGSSLVATHPARKTLRVDWIVFADTGELGK